MNVREGLRDFVARAALGSEALAARQADAIALIDAMTETWGPPPYRSQLARDGTPFEPSVRISAEPSELRWVLEAQPAEASREPRDFLDAALALGDRLAARGWVDLAPAQRLVDLFRDHLPRRQAVLWFGAALGEKGPAVIKNYFVCSHDHQWREAFARFGVPELAAELAGLLPRTARVEFVSVDLAGADPRLKLYVRHATCDPEAIDRAHSVSPSYRRGDAALLTQAILGRLPGVKGLGPISTFHVSIERRAVTHSAVNLPLEHHHYATRFEYDDDTLAARIATFAGSLGLTVDPLYPHLLATARADGVRTLHHRYAGLQRRGDRPEVTVYLSTLLQAK